MAVPVPAEARKGQVGVGPKVEAADELPGGKTFADIDGLKRRLLEDPDAIARA